MGRATSLVLASLNIGAGIFCVLVGAHLLNHGHFWLALIEASMAGLNAGCAASAAIGAAESH